MKKIKINMTYFNYKYYCISINISIFTFSLNFFPFIEIIFTKYCFRDFIQHVLMNNN